MRLVQTFTLPLECAPTLNAYCRMHWSKRKKLKENCLRKMLISGSRQSVPLPGKPLVVLTRKSSVEPDQDSAVTKIPLDCLIVKNGGLGYLRDDSPSAVSVECRWERAKRGAGCVVVEIWCAEEAA